MPVGVRQVLLVLIAFWHFSACRQAAFDTTVDPPDPVSVDLDSILRRGYISALIDNNSISYFIYKGEPMGYDYELLKLFADHLQVDLKINVTKTLGTAIEKLNEGEGDILAYPMTITKQRKQFVSFTRPHFNSYQVLVQRKPEGWRRLTADQIEQALIRNPVDLIGREVHVPRNSTFLHRLENLSEEIGGDIIIKVDSADAESEELIRRVARGEIEYTVANHAFAAVNAAYYPDIDVNTILSLPQQIAWGMRVNSPQLADAFNAWMDQIKKEPTFMVIFNRYYKSPNTSRIRKNSAYSSLGGNKLSPYDDHIREGAELLGWDWRLLAAVVYQESRFGEVEESWAGARGLMQLMPATAERFGAADVNDPIQNLRAGVKYLKYLDDYWAKRIPDTLQKQKFVLASYNAGLGHILDARNLAAHFGKDTLTWDYNVEEMLTRKSQPEYFNDPVVKLGYCKCTETVNYVRDVLNRYDMYAAHISGFPVAGN